MSHAVVDWVLEHPAGDVTQQMVLVAIASHANHDGGEAWPSVATLAHKCGCSARPVKYAIQRLEAAGRISVSRTAGRPNVYRVIMAETGAGSAPPPGLDQPGSAEGTGAGSAPHRGWIDPPPGLDQPWTGAGSAPESVQNQSMTQSMTPSPHGPPTAVEPLTLTLVPAPDETVSAFDAFWSLAVRKVGRGAAERAFAQARRRATVPAIMAGWRTANEVWATWHDRQFVPHPATWLNQDRWADDPPQAQAPPQMTARAAEFQGVRQALRTNDTAELARQLTTFRPPQRRTDRPALEETT